MSIFVIQESSICLRFGRAYPAIRVEEKYSSRMAEWTFLTNYAHALLCIAREPDIRLRDVAERVGVTERAAQRIVSDLVETGYLDRIREGRRNVYRIRADQPLRHPVERGHQVGALLEILRDHDGSYPDR